MRPLSRRGLLAGGAGAGVGLLLPGLTRSAAAQAGGGDPDLVNLLIVLELLQARLYAEGLERVPDLSGDVRDLLGDLRRQEAAHAVTLGRLLPALGGVAVPERQVDFGDALGSPSALLGLARQLEDTAVAAGNGVLAQLESRTALEAVAEIVAAEAAQAVAVRALADDAVLQGAQDRRLSQSQVVDRLEPYLPEAG